MGVVAVERRHAGSYGFVWVGGVLAGLVAVALLRGRPGCGQPSSTQHAAGQAARTGGEYIELSGTVAPCRNDVRSRLSFFSHEDVLSLMLCLALDEYRYIPRY